MPLLLRGLLATLEERGGRSTLSYEVVLTDIGLSSKEAQVYLSSLSLGPSSVQSIARKAQVARGTTYVVLDALMRRGLVTKLERGKRTVFVAEPPRHLLGFIDQEERILETKRQELEDILPELQALMKASEDKPTVRYFEGRQGVQSMLNEIVMQCQKGDMWYSLLPVDTMQAIFDQGTQSFTKQRMAKGIRAKTIFTTSSSQLRTTLLTQAHQELAERRYIPTERYTSASGLTIFRNSVAITTYADMVGGILIESASAADMMRESFRIMWESLAVDVRR